MDPKAGGCVTRGRAWRYDPLEHGVGTVRRCARHDHSAAVVAVFEGLAVADCDHSVNAHGRTVRFGHDSSAVHSAARQEAIIA